VVTVIRNHLPARASRGSSAHNSTSGYKYSKCFERSKECFLFMFGQILLSQGGQTGAGAGH